MKLISAVLDSMSDKEGEKDNDNESLSDWTLLNQEEALEGEQEAEDELEESSEGAVGPPKDIEEEDEEEEEEEEDDEEEEEEEVVVEVTDGKSGSKVEELKGNESSDIETLDYPGLEDSLEYHIVYNEGVHLGLQNLQYINFNRDYSADADNESVSSFGTPEEKVRKRRSRKPEATQDEETDLSLASSPSLPEDLPSIRPEPQYIHTPDQKLNSRLNAIVAFTLVCVLGLAIGHFLGWSSRTSWEENINAAQVRKLRELQEDLLSCMSLSPLTTENDIASQLTFPENKVSSSTPPALSSYTCDSSCDENPVFTEPLMSIPSIGHYKPKVILSPLIDTFVEPLENAGVIINGGAFHDDIFDTFDNYNNDPVIRLTIEREKDILKMEDISSYFNQEHDEILATNILQPQFKAYQSQGDPSIKPVPEIGNVLVNKDINKYTFNNYLKDITNLKSYLEELKEKYPTNGRVNDLYHDIHQSLHDDYMTFSSLQGTVDSEIEDLVDDFDDVPLRKPILLGNRDINDQFDDTANLYEEPVESNYEEITSSGDINLSNLPFKKDIDDLDKYFLTKDQELYFEDNMKILKHHTNKKFKTLNDDHMFEVEANTIYSQTYQTNDIFNSDTDSNIIISKESVENDHSPDALKNNLEHSLRLFKRVSHHLAKYYKYIASKEEKTKSYADIDLALEDIDEFDETMLGILQSLRLSFYEDLYSDSINNLDPINNKDKVYKSIQNDFSETNLQNLSKEINFNKFVSKQFVICEGSFPCDYNSPESISMPPSLTPIELTPSVTLILDFAKIITNLEIENEGLQSEILALQASNLEPIKIKGREGKEARELREKINQLISDNEDMRLAIARVQYNLLPDADRGSFNRVVQENHHLRTSVAKLIHMRPDLKNLKSSIEFLEQQNKELVASVAKIRYEQPMPRELKPVVKEMESVKQAVMAELHKKKPSANLLSAKSYLVFMSQILSAFNSLNDDEVGLIDKVDLARDVFTLVVPKGVKIPPSAQEKVILGRSKFKEIRESLQRKWIQLKELTKPQFISEMAQSTLSKMNRVIVNVVNKIKDIGHATLLKQNKKPVELIIATMADKISILDEQFDKTWKSLQTEVPLAQEEKEEIFGPDYVEVKPVAKEIVNNDDDEDENILLAGSKSASEKSELHHQHHHHPSNEREEKSPDLDFKKHMLMKEEQNRKIEIKERERVANEIDDLSKKTKKAVKEQIHKKPKKVNKDEKTKEIPKKEVNGNQQLPAKLEEKMRVGRAKEKVAQSKVTVERTKFHVKEVPRVAAESEVDARYFKGQYNKLKSNDEEEETTSKKYFKRNEDEDEDDEEDEENDVSSHHRPGKKPSSKHDKATSGGLKSLWEKPQNKKSFHEETDASKKLFIKRRGKDWSGEKGEGGNSRVDQYQYVNYVAAESAFDDYNRDHHYNNKHKRTKGNAQKMETNHRGKSSLIKDGEDRPNHRSTTFEAKIEKLQEKKLKQSSDIKLDKMVEKEGKLKIKKVKHEKKEEKQNNRKKSSREQKTVKKSSQNKKEEIDIDDKKIEINNKEFEEKKKIVKPYDKKYIDSKDLEDKSTDLNEHKVNNNPKHKREVKASTFSDKGRKHSNSNKQDSISKKKEKDRVAEGNNVLKSTKLNENDIKIKFKEDKDKIKSKKTKERSVRHSNYDDLSSQHDEKKDSKKLKYNRDENRKQEADVNFEVVKERDKEYYKKSKHEGTFYQDGDKRNNDFKDEDNSSWAMQRGKEREKYRNDYQNELKNAEQKYKSNNKANFKPQDSSLWESKGDKSNTQKIEKDKYDSWVLNRGEERAKQRHERERDEKPESWDLRRGEGRNKKRNMGHDQYVERDSWSERRSDERRKQREMARTSDWMFDRSRKREESRNDEVKQRRFITVENEDYHNFRNDRSYRSR